MLNFLVAKNEKAPDVRVGTNAGLSGEQYPLQRFPPPVSNTSNLWPTWTFVLPLPLCHILIQFLLLLPSSSDTTHN